MTANSIGFLPANEQKGLKIPNTYECTVHCDDEGYPQSIDCTCSRFARLFHPISRWTPGGGSPDYLPDLPKPEPGPSPYE